MGSRRFGIKTSCFRPLLPRRRTSVGVAPGDGEALRMQFDDETDDAPIDPSDEAGVLEPTDIDSDEDMDGDVDADGASAIPRRND